MKIIISESQYNRLLESIESESILIIGDSHSVDARFTYSSLMKSKYSDVKIAAVGGKRTSWMVDRLSQELSEKHYDKVIIWGGANDMFSNTSISTAISNIQKMVDMVNDQDGTAFVIVGFDQNIFSKKGKYKSKYVTSEEMDKMREKYIDFQDQLPSGIRNAIIIPSFDIDNSHTSDNMHGDSNAHRQVFEIVSDYLDSKKTIKSSDSENKKFESENLIDKLKSYIDSDSEFIARKKRSTIYETEVEDIQTALQLLGYSLPEWGVDGRFGPETKRATEDFQKDNDLVVTGNFSSEDLEELLKNLLEKGFDEKSLSNIQRYKTAELPDFDESFNTPVIQNPGVQVWNYPNNLEQKLKNIIGDEKFDEFVSKCRGVGLDPLIAIRQLYTESIGFMPSVLNCKRKSPKGAMGIAQFMPGTWPSYGDGSPCNVNDALDAYIKFMDYLLNRFRGRMDLAVASYNSGPNKAIYKKAHENNIPFTSLKGKIPGETYKYASTIFQP
jgi:peptidoglycan hydrolase-like protein with peptidoglycan-binding domain